MYFNILLYFKITLKRIETAFKGVFISYGLILVRLHGEIRIARPFKWPYNLSQAAASFSVECSS